MVVSVPEKTLEHWASIYLTYRYRSKASLWWPARGEDIYVGSLPAVPGKAVQARAKTTTLNKKGDVHRVKIDLKQLDHYLALPHGLQPFYVFPMPRWTDTLEDATAAVGLAVSEVGFSRVDKLSTKPWWFANWMVALTASQVGQILATQMAAFKAGGKVDADLVTTSFKVGRPQKPVWADGLRHVTIRWRTLWTRLEECGAASWPQVVLMPSWVTAGISSVRHEDIRSMLAEAREDPDGEVVVWGSTGDGTFEPIDAPRDVPDRAGADGLNGNDWRIAVGLSLKALKPGVRRAPISRLPSRSCPCAT
ncbi:hypothetical protein G5V59_26105 [Nocardioides sp. W3-2-3]|uniref:hypothetical protein n=1 Tax=Nocardioides convexus TaxID=2712224 RepID=UPI0024189326|nr:hypothetical protein [Nocardioides convexus]NHA01928.1 hypothetical protein [Nocardioides convexus]